MDEQQSDAYGLSTVLAAGRITAPDPAVPATQSAPLPVAHRHHRVRHYLHIPSDRLSARGRSGGGALRSHPGQGTRTPGSFFPDATVYAGYHDVLRRDDVEVVHVTPQPAGRAPILEDAPQCGTYVPSQKPLVLDLGKQIVCWGAAGAGAP